MKMKSLSYRTYLDRKQVRKERQIKLQTERKVTHEAQESYLESLFGSKVTS